MTLLQDDKTHQAFAFHCSMRNNSALYVISIERTVIFFRPFFYLNAGNWSRPIPRRHYADPVIQNRIHLELVNFGHKKSTFQLFFPDCHVSIDLITAYHWKRKQSYQCVLYFSRSQTVTANIDNVISAPCNAIVPIRRLNGAVAGAVVAGQLGKVGFHKALLITINSASNARPGLRDEQSTGQVRSMVH